MMNGLIIKYYNNDHNEFICNAKDKMGYMPNSKKYA